MRKTLAVAAAAGLALTAAACSSSNSAEKAAATKSPAMAASSTGPFGSGCSAVPATGKGSFTGMAADPVATAASNNPALSTLVSAVKAAGLVDTLNSAQNLTVFAPDNAAFAKIPKATLTKVLGDKTMLTGILTYHVVGQRLAPSALDSGTFKTLEGGTVTTSGSGMSYKVNDANVVCGNIKTANATVYIVDTVLMPPATK